MEKDTEYILLPFLVLPVFGIDELEDALKDQYGEDFIAEIQSECGSLRQLLFDDLYINDVCIKYSFRTLSEEKTIQDRLENCVNTFLMSVIPEAYSQVIIDVTW